jgi:hypothetical protein
MMMKMKNLFSDILREKVSAFAGKSLLFRFPAKGFFSALFISSVKTNAANGQIVSLQLAMVNSVLNNQFNQQQSNQQQQNRVT